jgi:hypothetical protein
MIANGEIPGKPRRFDRENSAFSAAMATTADSMQDIAN